MGPAGGYNGISWGHQRCFKHSCGLLQCRWAWPLGGRWQAPQLRTGKAHRNLLQPAGLLLAGDLRLSVHFQPRLQSRPWPGVRDRDPSPRTVLSPLPGAFRRADATRAAAFALPMSDPNFPDITLTRQVLVKYGLVAGVEHRGSRSMSELRPPRSGDQSYGRRAAARHAY